MYTTVVIYWVGTNLCNHTLSHSHLKAFKAAAHAKIFARAERSNSSKAPTSQGMHCPLAPRHSKMTAWGRAVIPALQRPE